MAAVFSQFSSWPSKVMELGATPDMYTSAGRVISIFFVTLGIAFILPALLLIFLDFVCWILRLARSVGQGRQSSGTRLENRGNGNGHAASRQK